MKWFFRKASSSRCAGLEDVPETRVARPVRWLSKLAQDALSEDAQWIIEDYPPEQSPIESLEMIIDNFPQLVGPFLKAYRNIYKPRKITFEDAGAAIHGQRPADPIIMVEIDSQPVIVTEWGLKDAKEWLYDVNDSELISYVPYNDFNEKFWSNPCILFHATDPENVESILEEGLSPRSESRAMSNNWVGDAVYAHPEPAQIDSYGSAVLAIDAPQMKADGYTPRVSQEEPFEDEEMRKQLAHKIGVHDWDYESSYSWEGLDPQTVVFFGPIPPKYLSLYE